MKKYLLFLVIVLMISTSCAWLGVASDTLNLVDEITNPQEQPKNPCPCDEH